MAVPTLLVKDIGNLATFDEHSRELENAAIHVAGNEIKWVGKTADLPPEYNQADIVLSMPDAVIIPGLCNTHHHMFQCLTRCIAQDVTLVPWLCTFYSAWEKITGEDLYVSAKLAMAELILSGCTTTSDHCYMFPNDARLDDTIKAAREIGLRFHPTRGASTIGESLGGYAPDSVCEDEEEVLVEMERLIANYHDNARYSMLRIGLAPTAMFKCTQEFFRKVAVLARQHPGVRLHSHLAEIEGEVRKIREQHGCSTSEYLKRIGWNKDDCWFAHCVQLEDSDLQHFSQNHIGVAHCPSSNMRLASGVARVREMVDAGVNCGLGVDGSASNDCGNMLAEVRLALFLQRAGGNPKAMDVREILRLSIQGGAKNLGRDDIGQIAPGFAADFVAWKTDSIGFAGAMQDPIAALVLCAPSLGSVDLSVINGRIVVQDGRLMTVDLKKVVRDHKAASRRICQHLPSWWKTGEKPKAL